MARMYNGGDSVGGAHRAYGGELLFFLCLVVSSLVVVSVVVVVCMDSGLKRSRRRPGGTNEGGLVWTKSDFGAAIDRDIAAGGHGRYGGGDHGGVDKGAGFGGGGVR